MSEEEKEKNFRKEKLRKEKKKYIWQRKGEKIYIQEENEPEIKRKRTDKEKGEIKGQKEKIKWIINTVS